MDYPWGKGRLKERGVMTQKEQSQEEILVLFIVTYGTYAQVFPGILIVDGDSRWIG